MNSLRDDVEKVAKLRKACNDMELRGREVLDKYTDEQLAVIYNGIGPDSFPEWLIDAIDGVAHELSPPCMIHDVEWLESDGKRMTFNESNERLRENGIAVADFKYGWWRPRRYSVRIEACALSAACQVFGFGTWLEYSRRTSRPVSAGLIMFT